MRRRLTIEGVNEFMREMAGRARGPGSVFFTGGATALLLGFREQTIDLDLKMDPEPAGAFEAIAELKNQLDLNIELASPGDFIPVVDDWRERSRHIQTIGKVGFYHFDFTLQLLAKLERGHRQDMNDATAFVRRGFVDLADVRQTFARIEPLLVRYPAVDPAQFKKKVQQFASRALA